MNFLSRIARSILGPIADAGDKFLDVRKVQGTANQIMLRLCEDLISHKGVASGIALARKVVSQYQSLDQNEKLIFFLDLSQKFAPAFYDIEIVAKEFVLDPGPEKLKLLSKQMQSTRQKLFSRMNMAPNGTKSIVDLREDLLSLIPKYPELKSVDEDLKVLLKSWFNPGFLTLEVINWDTEASILEKIIEYETVHNILSWSDLKQRLVKDRRCFAYFHPTLQDEPLIFVEVALTKGVTGSIQEIFDDDSNKKNGWNTAIFYSINNCQSGLRQIPLGNFLIKMVATVLARELPDIKTFSTLSPVTGFADWLKAQLKIGDNGFFAENETEALKILEEDSDWHKNKTNCKLLKKHLIRACAIYLVKVKKDGYPVNPVAKFHFGNGAELYRINWMGNTSHHGLNDSFGLMVNYLYNLKHIEANHEAYTIEGKLAVSKSIRKKVNLDSD